MREIGAFVVTFLLWTCLTALVVGTAVTGTALAYMGGEALARFAGLPPDRLGMVGSMLALIMIAVGAVVAFLTVAADVKEAASKPPDSRGAQKPEPRS